MSADASHLRATLSRRGFLAAATAAALAAHPAVALATPRSARALGAYVNPSNRALTAAEADAAFERFESRVGRTLGIRSYFVAWDEPFPAESHVADTLAGRTPLLAWYPPRDLASIAAGKWDALVRERAVAAAALRHPLFVRFASEFNGEWSGISGRQRDFVAAWRHLVKLFRRAGAENVRWVWCPYALRPRTRNENWRTYWPGGEYVDWIGMDGYNWGSSRPWSSWQSFGEIFEGLYADYARRKPIMICEVASAEVGGDKAAWIRDMHRSLGRRFAAVRAVAWFDVDKETDWRVASSRASLAAFRALAADPRLA
jgi:hypothetical protein